MNDRFEPIDADSEGVSDGDLAFSTFVLGSLEVLEVPNEKTGVAAFASVAGLLNEKAGAAFFSVPELAGSVVLNLKEEL